MPDGCLEPVRKSAKLIRGTIENSRIYLPLWRISSAKFFWTGLRDRPSEERRDSAVPRYLRFAPCRNILRASSVQSFQREVSSVLQLRGLSNGGFNSRPISSPLLMRSVQLQSWASMKWIAFDIGNAFTAARRFAIDVVWDFDWYLTRLPSLKIAGRKFLRHQSLLMQIFCFCRKHFIFHRIHRYSVLHHISRLICLHMCNKTYPDGNSDDILY